MQQAGILVHLIFWKIILKFSILSGSGPGTSSAWFLGSAPFAASWSSCYPQVFNFLARKPLHMINLTSKLNFLGQSYGGFKLPNLYNSVTTSVIFGTLGRKCWIFGGFNIFRPKLQNIRVLTKITAKFPDSAETGKALSVTNCPNPSLIIVIYLMVVQHFSWVVKHNWAESVLIINWVYFHCDPPGSWVV